MTQLSPIKFVIFLFFIFLSFDGQAKLQGCYQTTKGGGRVWDIKYCRDPQLCSSKGGVMSNGQCVDPYADETRGKDVQSEQLTTQCRKVMEKCQGQVTKDSDGICSCPDALENQNGEDSTFKTPEALADLPGISASVCQQTLAMMQQECDAEYASTANSCNEKEDAGINNFQDGAAAIALALGQQTSSSVLAACSKMAGVVQGANAALAGYRVNCSNAISSCKSSCSKVKQYIQKNASCLVMSDPNTRYDVLIATADEETKKCSGFENKIQEAQQAIQNYGATSANATQCAALTSGNPNALAEYCAKNPTQPVCQTMAATDCSNPTVAAKDKICICRNSPNSAECFQKASADANSIMSSTDSSSRLAQQNSADYGGDIPDLPSIAQRKANGGEADAVDGNQGGSGVGGGGGGSGGGESGGQAGADPRSTNVNGGFYGGGGGTRYGSAGGGAAGAAGGRYGTNGVAGKPGGPDLRQFLPGGQYDPRRGVAGSAGSGPDGITGPNSNIWHKIQNRYRVMSPTLLP